MPESFDPDAFLRETPEAPSFDPDAFLAEKPTETGFDPDAFLSTPATPTTPQSRLTTRRDKTDVETQFSDAPKGLPSYRESTPPYGTQDPQKPARQLEAGYRDLVSKFLGTGTTAQSISQVEPSGYEELKGGLNQMTDSKDALAIALKESGGDIDKAIEIANKTQSAASQQASYDTMGDNPFGMLAGVEAAKFAPAADQLTKLRDELDAAGVPAADRPRIIQDAARANAWTEKDTDNIRKLSTGEIAINPGRLFGQKDALVAEINATDTDPADKAEALSRLDALRAASAEKLSNDLYYGDTRLPGATEFRDFLKEKEAKGQAGDLPAVLDEWSAQQKDRNVAFKFIDSIVSGVSKGGLGIEKTVVGGLAGVAAATGLPGAETLAGTQQLLSDTRESASQAEKFRGADGITNDIFDTVTQMAPMFAGGAYAKGLTGLSQKVTQGMSVYGWAGLQGYESKGADAIEMEKTKLGRELSGEEVVGVLKRPETQAAMFANAAQTVALAYMNPGGVERAALGTAAKSMTVMDFVKGGGLKALRDKPLKKELAAMAKTIFLKDAPDEMVEEITNQILDEAISTVALGKDMKLGDLFENAGKAGLMGFGIGGALPQLRSTPKSPAEEAARDLVAGAAEVMPQSAAAAQGTPGVTIDGEPVSTEAPSLPIPTDFEAPELTNPQANPEESPELSLSNGNEQPTENPQSQVPVPAVSGDESGTAPESAAAVSETGTPPVEGTAGPEAAAPLTEEPISDEDAAFIQMRKDESARVRQEEQAKAGPIGERLNEIEAKWKAEGVEVVPTMMKDSIELTVLQMPKVSRGQGTGSKVLADFKALADESGKPITVLADDIAKTGRDPGPFYEKNGFTPLGKGRYAYTPAAPPTQENLPEGVPQAATSGGPAVGGSETPLGLSRQPVVNLTLKSRSDSEFDTYSQEVKSNLNRMEKAWDENDALGDDPAFREELANAQDDYSAVENEEFRRYMENAEPEDMAYEFRQLDPANPFHKVKMALLLDAANRRGIQGELKPFLNEYANRSSDHAEVLAGKLADAAKVVQEMGGMREPSAGNLSPTPTPNEPNTQRLESPPTEAAQPAPAEAGASGGPADERPVGTGVKVSGTGETEGDTLTRAKGYDGQVVVLPNMGRVKLKVLDDRVEVYGITSDARGADFNALLGTYKKNTSKDSETFAIRSLLVEKELNDYFQTTQDSEAASRRVRDGETPIQGLGIPLPPASGPTETETGTPEDDSVTGLYHAQTDADRARLGLPPRFTQPRTTDQEAWDRATAAEDAHRAAAKPGTAGTDLLTNLLNSPPGVLEKDEHALLLHEKLVRQTAVEAAQSKLNSLPDGDPTRKDAQAAVQKAQDAFDLLITYADAAGSRAGLSLQARKMLVYSDFTLAAVVNRLKAAKNMNSDKPVAWTEKDQKAAVEIANKLQQAQERIEALEAGNDAQTALIEQLTKDVERAQTKLENRMRTSRARTLVTEKLNPLVEAAKARMAARKGTAPTEQQGNFAVFGPTPEMLEDIKDISIIASGWIANKALTLEEFSRKLTAEFGDWLAEHAQTIFRNARSLYIETAESVTEGNAPTPASVMESIDATEALDKSDVWKLAKAHVIAGKRGRNVLDAVFGDLLAKFPDVTREQVSEAFTGYGTVVYPSTKEVPAELRRIRSLEREYSKQLDIAAGLMPKRTGYQGDVKKGPEWAEVRAAQQKTADALRELENQLREAGLPVPSDDKKLANSLNTAMKRLTNEMEEIQLAIDTNTARTPKTRTPLAASPELDALKKQLEAKRAEYDQKFKDETARERRILGSIAKRKAELERRMSDPKNPDFSKPEVKAPVNTEATRKANYELSKVRAAYDEMRYKYMLANAPFATQAGSYVIGSGNLLKLMVLGTDVGVIMRQLGTTFQGVTRDLGMLAPTKEGAKKRADGSYVKRVLVEGARAFGSSEYEHAAYERLMERRNAGWDKTAGLILNAPFDVRKNSTEDIPPADLLEKIPWWIWPAMAGIKVSLLGASFPVSAAILTLGTVAKPLTKALDRAQRTMTNQSRAMFFDAALDVLHDGHPTVAEAKAIAKAVMVGTGRGTGVQKIESAIPLMNQVLLATRYYISRIQAASLYPLWNKDARTSSAARKEIARMYGRSVAGRAVLYGLAAVAFGKALTGDDDEPEEGLIVDPRNPNFMRLKLAEGTSIDFASSINQYISLTARMWTKTKIDPKTGEKIALGSGFSNNAVDEATKFLATKMNLQLGFAKSIYSKAFFGGKPATPANIIDEMTTAIIINDTFNTYDTMMKEYGPTLGAARASVFLGMMFGGAGASVYSTEAEKEANAMAKKEAEFARKQRQAELNE